MVKLFQFVLFSYLYDYVFQAQSFGTKIVDEDGVLDLLRSLPGKKSKYELAAEKEVCSQLNILSNVRIILLLYYDLWTISDSHDKI